MTIIQTLLILGTIKGHPKTSRFVRRHDATSHERVYHWHAELWDVPFVHLRDVTLQQDNAQPHVARICKQFLETEYIPVLLWPIYSSDMSAIENVWDLLDHQVRQHFAIPGNVLELCTALEEEWDYILQATIDNLAGSMRRRCRPYCTARGHWRTYQILMALFVVAHWISVCKMFELCYMMIHKCIFKIY